MTDKVEVYNKLTGQKLPYRVPKAWLNIFPDAISETPKSKKAEKATTTKEA